MKRSAPDDENATAAPAAEPKTGEVAAAVVPPAAKRKNSDAAKERKRQKKRARKKAKRAAEKAAKAAAAAPVAPAFTGGAPAATPLPKEPPPPPQQQQQQKKKKKKKKKKTKPQPQPEDAALFAAVVRENTLGSALGPGAVKASALRALVAWLASSAPDAPPPARLAVGRPPPAQLRRVVVVGVAALTSRLLELTSQQQRSLLDSPLFTCRCECQAPGDKLRVLRTADVLLGVCRPQFAPAPLEALLLDDVQLAEIGFPHSAQPGFLATRPAASLLQQQQQQQQQLAFGLDCEMAQTANGLEVTRVSVADWSGASVYDAFVRPVHDVVDYVTRVSGVTKEDVEQHGKPPSVVRDELLALIPAEAVLIGHSLENDLQRLGIAHRRVVDTTVIFPHEQFGHKSSLSWLVRRMLHRELHPPGQPHSSLDDARACIELVKHRIAGCASPQDDGDDGSATDKHSGVQSLLTTELVASGSGVTFIDSASNVARHTAVPAPPLLHAVVADSDEMATAAALEAMRSDKSRFIWIRLASLQQPSADLDAASCAGGYATPDRALEQQAVASASEALAQINKHVQAILEAAEPGTLVVLAGLQGVCNKLPSLRTTSAHNNDHLWTPGHTVLLQAAATQARLSPLRIALF